MKLTKRYSSVDGTVFEVLSTWTDDAGDWIGYQNANSKQTYSCLVDAFLQRFHPTVD